MTTEGNKEVARLEAIVHGEAVHFTKRRIIQFVLANADPADVAGIAGTLIAQSFIHTTTGTYKELPDDV